MKSDKSDKIKKLKKKKSKFQADKYAVQPLSTSPEGTRRLLFQI